MAQFRYRAIDGHGQTDDGVIDATSLHDASEKLRSREVTVVSIEELTVDATRYEPDGTRPPEAPRDVTLRLRDMPGGTVLLMVGGIFTAVAVPIVVSGLVVLASGTSGGAFITLFPLIHLTIGVALVRYVFLRRRKAQDIYRHGTVSMATVDGVGYNRSLRVNGRNPYELVWSLEVQGHRYSDKKSSFDERVMTFAPGDRMWVIYDPNDPEESVEWPPLTR